MLHKVNLTKILSGLFLLFLFSNSISAHCDSVEGPVVHAAKKTLETGNLNYVFIWLQPEDEAEIEKLYKKVVKVSDINEDVRELADMYFYETVVRVHRMSEGVGYTGLEFEDFQPAVGIEAADRAIEKDSVEEILSHINDKSKQEPVKHYFTDLQSKRNFEVNDVEAGREYVKSYVHFIHYVEGLFGGATDHNDSHNKAHTH
ncbi:MAG: DUF6448 family protein [Melioribacteraceae bacterium]|nr:MAG: DUF6448 family protein [Melioribacteraceae bacterium]